jgi:drug/metabolite transporter (DMT)-like permease
MKSEKIIVGFILTAVGMILLYWGYKKTQPDVL